MSAFHKLAKVASGSLSQRPSLEIPKENLRPPNGDQDYVLVNDDDNGSASTRAPDTPQSLKGDSSPAPFHVELQVPPVDDIDDDTSETVQLKLDTDTLAAWRVRNSADRANSVNTDRTDYSGLNEHASPQERDQVHQKALHEANQQHEWAMEAVIRGWESEKAELLQKLRAMTEARDTLEVELKHSETSFAGMLDGMLDQKLDQMLSLLQDSGIKPPLSPNSGSLGSPSPLTSQPTVQKAQQVVHDLGAMLDTMKMQQSAMESRVGHLQSAVLQLLPPEGQHSRLPAEVFPAQGEPPQPPAPKRSILRQSVMGVGSFCNQTRYFLSKQVPRAAHTAGDLTAKAVAIPVNAASNNAGRLTRHLRSRGLRNEHLTAAAGAAAGILATTVLVRSLGPSKRGACPSEAVPEPLDVHEIEITGPEDPPVDEDDLPVEIILNRHGVFRRAGPEAPALVVAWPI